MALFNSIIPRKHKELSHHPWENRIKDIYSRTYKYGHNSAKNPCYPSKKAKIPDAGRIKFTVIGNRITKEFIYCLYLVKGLHKYRQKEFKAPVIRGLTSIEWPKVWNDLKILYGGLSFCLKSQVAILMDDKFLGGEDELKALIDSKYIYYFRLDYYKEGIRQFGNFIKSSGRPFVYLQIAIDDVPIGTLIFMLYADIVPHTCENFLRLCDTKKGGYGGTCIHRIVEDCWIQCGGFGLKSSNLECENYIVQHDRRGVLCMANNGRHVDCSTQFFVLLQPAPWMEHKYVAFGQLIEGEKTLATIEKVPTYYESPISKIMIYNAGVFNMECHNITINKNTHAYLHGHIENLFIVGEMFYEELLEKVFTIVERGAAEEHNIVKNVHSTQRFIRRKEEIIKQSLDTASSSDSENNDEFDVDIYELCNEYEFEDFSYSKQTSDSCVVIKLEKPFYLPFTDVPYPGEVDSTYDLKKFLKGDYCLESDLEKDPVKRRQQQLDTNPELAVLGGLLDALIENYELKEEESDSSLDMNDDYEIKNYIKDNLDNVSFAGPIIRKIANMKKKYELLKDTEGKNRRLFTDEELRIFRMASKEYNDIQKKKVRIEPMERSEDANLRRAQASEPYLPSGPPRQSVLARLYEDVTIDSDDEGPTLKDYKPYSESQQRNFMLLTRSPTHFIDDDDDSREKFRRISHLEDHSIDKVLWLQHGMKVSRKISSDYVRTIDHIEHNLEMSLRVIDFGKKRPSMSVAQYHLRNQKYKEEMAAIKSASKAQTKDQ